MAIYMIKGEDANKFIEKVGGKLNKISLSKDSPTVIVMPDKKGSYQTTKKKRGPKFKLNAFQVAKLVRDCREGVNKGKIAKDYGISLPAVYKYQRKWEPILNGPERCISKVPHRVQHLKGQLSFQGMN
jgi:transposase